MPTAATRTVVDAYRSSSARLRNSTIVALSALWYSLPDYSDDTMSGFVATTSSVVHGSRLQAARLTAGYLALVETIETGGTARPIPVRPVDVTGLRGVGDDIVYRRPVGTLRTALSEGLDFAEAQRRGALRLESLVGTDVQLARTHTAQRSLLGARQVTGYQRVIQGVHTCALCVVASTERYTRGDLMPIHPGCDCTVLPIYGDDDPGPYLDPDRLDGIHDLIESTFGVSSAGARGIPGQVASYRDVLVTHNHGEIGPVLAVRGHQFTGPGDVKVTRSAP